MKTQVLLVDDDVELLDITQLLMHQTAPDFELIVADSVQKALTILDDEEIDTIVADSSGLDLLEVLRSSGDEIPVIIWTGHSTEKVVIKALNLGAAYYIVKTPDVKDQIKQIHKIISKIVAKKRAKQPRIISQKDASEFIHRLSHDIIGILQNIMGYVTLLNEEYDASYLEGIGRLTQKLNDRMKTAVSELDSGNLTN